jgi:hypothetical protein
MSHRKTLSGLFVAPLLVAAIAAPTASAMIDEPLRPTTAGAVLEDARQLDMHASTVVKPEAQKQDLRGEATIDTVVLPQTHSPAPAQDLRGEAAADKPAPKTPVGLPTWPLDPKPIVPVANAPVATTTGGGDDGIEWPLSGILLAGALLLGGTIGVAGAHFRVRQSHA